MTHCEILIIGAGAAGMSAAVSAWASGCRRILLVDRASRLGGILPQCVHEGFGREELTGPAYAERLRQRLSDTDVQLLLGRAVLSVSKEKTAVISGGGNLEEISFEKLILATGCRERSIGSLLLGGTRPAGIFTAGQAQEMINLQHWSVGSRIVIVGSGDLGMIMARRLTLEGKTVVAVLEQNERYGGMTRNYRRCIEAFQIPILYRTVIREIHGMPRVTGVTAEHLDSGARELLSCDTLVTALGLIPEQTLVRDLGDPAWLFYAGNCRRVHDMAESAAAEGETVGRTAAEFPWTAIASD